MRQSKLNVLEKTNRKNDGEKLKKAFQKRPFADQFLDGKDESCFKIRVKDHIRLFSLLQLLKCRVIGIFFIRIFDLFISVFHKEFHDGLHERRIFD